MVGLFAIPHLGTYRLPTGTYSAQLFRQEADLRDFMADEQLLLDPDTDYNAVVGLSSEVRERLCRVRPTTIVCAVSRCQSSS